MCKTDDEMSWKLLLRQRV